MAKILIIEDNKSDSLLMSKILRQDGHTVYVVEDGLYATSVAEEVRPDLIILDLNINGVSVIDVCYDIRAIKELEHVVILVATMYSDMKTIEDAFHAGANDYTVKPVNSTLL